MKLTSILATLALCGAVATANADEPIAGIAAKQTCAATWLPADTAEKAMYLSGYLTAIAGATLILGDMGTGGMRDAIDQLWPKGADSAAVLAQVDAYCAAVDHGEHPIALALAAVARGMR